jgi:energy-coupling factor transport system ATP-binding protein
MCNKSRHPVTLSGGQKQRLSVACGLFSDRETLIFDEPTSGLDGDNLHIISNDLFKRLF